MGSHYVYKVFPKIKIVKYCRIVDRYCYRVVNRLYFFFFLQDFSMHRMLVISLFHHVESSPFCNRYYLFTLSFLTKHTRHGRNIVSFYFLLFICGRAKCLSREQCVGSNARADALCQLQPASFSNGDQQLCKKLDDHC